VPKRFCTLSCVDLGRWERYRGYNILSKGGS